MIRADENFEITNTLKGKLPSLPFSKMKTAVLGDKYRLSLVFIGDKQSRDLNRQFRAKDKPTNILSFALDKNYGEIFINPRKAEKEAPEFGLSFSKFLGLLFIHGLFHLKGFEHGSKMETKERRMRARFGI